MYTRYRFAAPKPILGRVPARRGFAGSRLHDAINSPGFPGSSTFYGNLSGASDLGFDFASTLNTLTSGVKSVTETALPAYMQYRIFQTNLDRAKSGAAPLDSQAYAPSMRVQVEPDPATLRTIGGIGIGTIALLGLGAFLLLRRK
jgi:hypothetical protein